MNKPWFRAKRYGIGAGLPLRWQGWLTYLAFAGVMAGLWMMPEHGRPQIARIGLTCVAVAILCVVVARHTAGGWRWRWGK
jgi:hypothetical protein